MYINLLNVNFRDRIVVSISACHADDPGSIPGRGVEFCIASGINSVLGRDFPLLDFFTCGMALLAIFTLAGWLCSDW